MFLLRYPEVILNKAEALAMLGREDDSKACLQELRSNRFKGADLQSVVETGDDYITFVRDERRRELCFEGHRWFDLRRTTRPRLEKTYSGTTYVLEENDSRYTIRIPSEAIEANPGLAN